MTINRALVELSHIPVLVGIFMHYTPVYIYRLEVEQKGIGWRCVGTVYDQTGVNILAQVERDYTFLVTTNYDLCDDMINLLHDAAPTHKDFL